MTPEEKDLWLDLSQDKTWREKVLRVFQMRQQRLFRALAEERAPDRFFRLQGQLQELETLMREPERVAEEAAEERMEAEGADGPGRFGNLPVWGRRWARRLRPGRE